MHVDGVAVLRLALALDLVRLFDFELGGRGCSGAQAQGEQERGDGGEEAHVVFVVVCMYYMG